MRLTTGRPPCLPHDRHRQRGQALVLAVVFALVLCMGVLVLFSSSQSVNRKSQLVNAADAAAYSVAVQQARVLNFTAYTQRARVANEVAVAQVIGLYSWMNQLNTTAITFQRTLSVLRAIPYVGPVFAAMAQAFQAMDRALRTIRRVYRPLAAALVVALDKLNGVLASSTGILFNTVTRAADAITLGNRIAEANAPGARLSTPGNGVLTTQLHGAFNDFIEEHRIPQTGTRPGADRFRNVVMKSRDTFSRTRDQDWNLFLIRFNQAGGTDMVAYDRWAALDGLTLEINLPWPLDDIDLPLGWGGAQAVERNQRQAFLNGLDWRDVWDANRLHRAYGDARRQLGNRTVRNVQNDPNVRLAGGDPSGSYFTGYNGLRDYHDTVAGAATTPVNRDGRWGNGTDQNPRRTGPIFTVHLESAAALSRTAEHVDGIGAAPGGRLHLPDRLHDGKLNAMATGQVYFNRPFALNGFARADRKLEHGNLFSPYWQARLVQTPGNVAALLELLP